MSWRATVAATRADGPGPAKSPAGLLRGRVTEARALRAAGDYPVAAARLRAAIAQAETELGAAAPELVPALNELGMLGKYSGDHDEAAEAYDRALRICVEHGKATGADAAAILHNLGGLAHARGDAPAAEALARRGISVRSTLRGADHLVRANDDAALAAILIDLGRFGEARAILTRVLAAYAQDRPRHQGEIAAALHNLGSVDFREGRFAEAAGNLRRAAAVKRTVLGRRHPDLAITLYNLACAQRQLGRAAAARGNLRRAIRILAPAVTPDHPTLAACRHKLEQENLS